MQVEFVSANPTGPLTAGNGRGAAIGSVLASVLEAAGYDVEREYLVNDAGTQTEVFGRTLRRALPAAASGKDVEIPADGYPGEYMIDIAKRLRDESGDAYADATIDEPPPEMVLRGVDMMVEGIEQDLLRLGVTYDVWFRERWVYDDGEQRLRRGDEGAARQGLPRREGGRALVRLHASWARTRTTSSSAAPAGRRTSRRTSPITTTSSCARKFDRVIDVWGADHQGHVSRMKAAAQALGVDPSRLDILIYQLVSFRRGEELVRLSKRSGNIVLMRDVVDEVGAGCGALLLPLALRRQPDGVRPGAGEAAVGREPGVLRAVRARAHRRHPGEGGGARSPSFEDADVALLTHPMELALIKKMLELPELVQLMARTMEPHHLPHYAQRAGDGVPRVLHGLPRDRRRERAAVAGAAEALPGGEDRAGARADADGDVDAGADVSRSSVVGDSVAVAHRCRVGLMSVPSRCTMPDDLVVPTARIPPSFGTHSGMVRRASRPVGLRVAVAAGRGRR